MPDDPWVCPKCGSKWFLMQGHIAVCLSCAKEIKLEDFVRQSERERAPTSTETGR